MSENSIGIFDSGIGGLSVAAQIIKTLPQESISYFADFKHVPYGERPYEQIKSYAAEISKFLISKNVKAIVMACNISSAVALDNAKKLFPSIPIFGMIKPGALAACAAAGSEPIGILATTGTIKCLAYNKAIAEINKNILVYGEACPEFVPLVESGMTESADAYEAAEKHARPLIEKGCKTIVLGCTHYPFLTNAIRKAVGDGVNIIDPAYEAAKMVKQILSDKELLATGENRHHRFYASAHSDEFCLTGSVFLGEKIENVSIVCLDMCSNNKI